MSSQSEPDQAKQRPTHIAYFTRPGRQGEKDFWTACGAAWAHKDGKGFRLRIDAMPIGGVMELRINEPKATNDHDSDWNDTPSIEAD